ncbi:hypothetical protein EUGRSUZ_K00620 [Eucalyptus grandis]|uniref:Uncharacterized protein n=2 Tax=Eucalyptus grandis TaxID=71139 RepID=A0ACC3IR19_EUCGR|nr:hypothetical protein EUGRSUZ_K00620 [Eucalyptus grandis]
MNWLDPLDNNIGGEVPFWRSNHTRLVFNNLTSVLSVCLSNFSESLVTLNLKGNNFHRSIHKVLLRGMHLTIIDLSDNQLQGKLPGSLANCKMLEFINFANNLIDLHVLILQSIKYPGVIERPKSSSTFLKLLILDLPNNALCGKLPREFFQSWNAMKSEMGNSTYSRRTTYDNHYYEKIIGENSYFFVTFIYGNVWSKWYPSSSVGGYDYPMTMTLTYKGLEMYYQKISCVFTDVDLSSNLFEGETPGVIGELKGLQGLSLSKNLVIGHSPLSLRNLTALEKLTELRFLSFLNMSYNNLTRFVPRGKQLDIFSNDPFEGNSGLYLVDASRQPSTHEEEELGSLIELD